MILGIGVDIVEISRIKDTILTHKERFLHRVYTEYEIKAAPSKQSDRYYAYFAKRFAAKEALVKAKGLGIGKIIGFKDIEVRNNEQGQPLFSKGPLPNEVAYLSLSDTENMAIAYVVIANSNF